MAEYGYAYRSVSTYSTMRNGTREPAVIKPFVPPAPKSNGSNYSEGAVTKKTIVPVTSRPYDEPATEKYASSGDESDESDDDEQYRQTSAVHNSPRKVDNQFPTKVQNHEASRNPQRFGPIADRGRHSPQPMAEGRKPIGISPIRNDKHDGINVYGGDHRPTIVGDPYPHKEERKPIGGGGLKSTRDGYNNNGYGGDKEGRKPIGISPIRNDNYDGPNGYGGDHPAGVVRDPYPHKEGRKPIGGGSIKSGPDSYNNGYGGDKEGHRPIGISPIRNDNYDGGDRRAGFVGDPYPYKEGRKPIGGGSIRGTPDGYNNGYGDDKEGRKPIGTSPIRNDNYDGGDHRVGFVGDSYPYKEGRKPIGGGSIRSSPGGYNNGYGDDKEGRKPIGISPIRNDDNYDGGDHRAGFVRDPYPYKEGRKPIGGGSLRSSPDGYNNRYGDDKEGRKPIGISPIRNDNYDGSHGYGGDHRAAVVGDPNLYKEGRKPIGIGSIRSDNYDGDKEGRKPIVSSIKNDNYDGPNGYGSDYNKKEGYKPTRNGNYGITNRDNKPFGSSSNLKYDDSDNVNYYNNRSNSNGPKISSDWTRAPRQGTQLSEPIHDIDKAMELLKMEAAKRDHYYDSPDNWGAPGNSSPRFTDRTSSSITRTHGNFNQPQSRPRDSATRVTFVDDGRDYYRSDDSGRFSYGYHDAVIDSREAEKKFKGTRV